MGTKDSKDIIAPVVAWHDNTSSNTNSNSNLELLPELPPKDNFIDWQSDGEKMWMAVRISKMLENMDHHTAVLEARNLLKLKKNPRQLRPKPDFNFHRVYNFEIDTIQDMYLLSLRWRAYFHELVMRNRNDYGDPMEAWQLILTLEDQKCNDIRECIAEKIHHARQEAKEILINMKDINTMRSKEIYLLRQFIKSQFRGYQYRLIGQYLDYKEPNYTKMDLDSIRHYFVIFILPIYFFIIALSILFIWQNIGYGAAGYWGLGVFTSYLLEVVAIQPLCLWAMHVAMPNVLRLDLILCWRILRTRARSLVTRNHHNKAGSIMDHQTNSMIQHFNPACRVARALPHLSVSRILIALNDFDMPFASLKLLHTTTYDKYSDNEDVDKVIKRCKAIYNWFSITFITLLSYLPYEIQDLILDFIIIILFYQSLLLFGIMSGGVSGLSAIYIIVIIGIIIGIEIYSSKIQIMTDEEKVYSVGRMCPRRPRKKKTKKHHHHHGHSMKEIMKDKLNESKSKSKGTMYEDDGMDALVNLMAIARDDLKDKKGSNNKKKGKITKIHVMEVEDYDNNDSVVTTTINNRSKNNNNDEGSYIDDEEYLDDGADIPIIEYKRTQNKNKDRDSRRRDKIKMKSLKKDRKEEEENDKKRMKELGLKYNAKTGDWETSEEREQRRRIKKEKKRLKLLKKEEKDRILKKKLNRSGLSSDTATATDYHTDYNTDHTSDAYGDSTLIDSLQSLSIIDMDESDTNTKTTYNTHK